MTRIDIAPSGPIALLRTRLVLTWLWWRHVYAFNLAHKPLCERFKHDVFRFGHLHLCRSCTLLYASAAATGIALLCVEWPETSLAPLFYSFFAGVLVLSYPPLYERLHRLVKDVVRCAAGSLMVLMIVLFVAGHCWLGLFNVVVFAAGYRLSLNEYRKWKLRACNGCTDLDRLEVCRGYHAQADRIRAYEMAAEEYLIHKRTVQESGAWRRREGHA